MIEGEFRIWNMESRQGKKVAVLTTFVCVWYNTEYEKEDSENL